MNKLANLREASHKHDYMLVARTSDSTNWVTWDENYQLTRTWADARVFATVHDTDLFAFACQNLAVTTWMNDEDKVHAPPRIVYFIGPKVSDLADFQPLRRVTGKPLAWTAEGGGAIQMQATDRATGIRFGHEHIF